LKGLHRIISGVIRTKYLVVKAPSLYTLIEADSLYEESYNRAYADKCMTREQLKEMVVDAKILPAGYEDQIKTIRSKIEDFKLDYFEDFLIPSRKEANKKNIEDSEFSIAVILSAFARFNQLTCGSIAETAKSLYILENSTFYHDGKPYDWKHVSIEQLQNYLYGVYVDEEVIRKMSMCPEWRDIWSIRDVCPIFEKKAYELTREQRDLVVWSKFYDSVFESSDRPSTEVIIDHYAIDGWAIKNRRDYEAQKEEINIKDKFGDAQEVFKVGNNSEDIKAIRDLNSPQSKAIQDKRFANLV